MICLTNCFVILFKVEYLGSVALNRQSSDLMALQQPLSQLYMKYLAKEDNSVKKNIFFPNEEGNASITLPGSIEISKTGLKVCVLYIRTRNWSF